MRHSNTFNGWERKPCERPPWGRSQAGSEDRCGLTGLMAGSIRRVDRHDLLVVTLVDELDLLGGAFEGGGAGLAGAAGASPNGSFVAGAGCTFSGIALG